MKKKRSGKHFEPQDRYFQEAKRRGFRSRAAFKLLEIEKKYSLFKKGDSVLDLGAAPGGWSQIALEAVGPQGHALGVDLQNITGLPYANYSFIKGDLRESLTIEKIRQKVSQVDVVLSDMSPKTTGIKFKDQLESAELSGQSLEIAQQFLKTGGHFVTKIFPGEKFASIKKEIKSLFQKVYEFTPEASRHTSKEVYLIAKGFKYTKK